MNASLFRSVRGITMRWLTPKQVAARYPISTSTLAKWRVYGTGPDFSRLGGRVVYSEDAVEDYLRSRMARSTSDRPVGPRSAA